MYTKYILKKGKRIGPYYYESLRLRDGRVKAVYLGRTKPTPEERNVILSRVSGTPHPQTIVQLPSRHPLGWHPHLFLWLTFAFIVFGYFFFSPDGQLDLSTISSFDAVVSRASSPITGFVISSGGDTLRYENISLRTHLNSTTIVPLLINGIDSLVSLRMTGRLLGNLDNSTAFVFLLRDGSTERLRVYQYPEPPVKKNLLPDEFLPSVSAAPTLTIVNEHSVSLSSTTTVEDNVVTARLLEYDSTFTFVDLDGDFMFYAEDMSGMTPPEGMVFVRTYAIDASALTYETLRLSRTALGNQLYVCRLWDWNSQVCVGTWEFEAAIDGDYTVFIDSPTVGFAEALSEEEANLLTGETIFEDVIGNITDLISGSENVSGTPFVSSCVDTCSLRNYGDGNYTLLFNLGANTSLYVDSIEVGYRDTDDEHTFSFGNSSSTVEPPPVEDKQSSFFDGVSELFNNIFSGDDSSSGVGPIGGQGSGGGESVVQAGSNGWYTVSNETTTSTANDTITIPYPVNTSKAFILLTYADGTLNGAADIGYYAQWMNSSSYKLIANSTATAGLEIVSTVVEGDKIWVQNGTANYSAAVTNISIAIQSVNITRTVVFMTWGSCSSNTNTDASQIWWVGNVTNSTTLRLVRGASGNCNGTVAYFVTEFQDGSTIHHGRLQNVGLSTLITHPNISTNSTWYYLNRGSSTSINTRAYVLLQQVNSTTFNLSRIDNTGQSGGEWYVIDTPGALVQNGTTDMTAAVVNTALTAIQLNTSFSTTTYKSTNTGSTHQHAMTTTQVNATTNLVAKRGGLTGTTIAAWFAVQMPAGTLPAAAPNAVQNYPPDNQNFTHRGNITLNTTVTDPNGDNTSVLIYGQIGANPPSTEHVIFFKNKVASGTSVFHNWTAPPVNRTFFIDATKQSILLAHFDNNSLYGENKTLVLDFSNHYNGTVSGTSGILLNTTGGILGGSIQGATGVGDNYVDFGDADSYIGTNLTYAFWAYPFTNVSNSLILLSKISLGAGFELTQSKANLTYQVNGDAVTRAGDEFFGPYFGRSWVHVAVVIQSTGSTSEISFYRNGLLYNTSPISTPSSNNIAFGLLGQPLLVSDSGFNGTLDEFVIINGTLNATDIAQLYQMREGLYRWIVNVTDGALSNLSPVRTFTLNTPPNVTVATLTPAVANTTDQITCTFNPEELIDTSVTCTVIFYNSTLTSETSSASYTPNIQGTKNAVSGVQAKLESWTCGIQCSDQLSTGPQLNSSAVTIVNSPPNTPTLTGPTNHAVTTDTTPDFTWTGNDPDNDALNYTLNITSIQIPNTFFVGGDHQQQNNRTTASFTPSDDLDLFGDDSFRYNWTVKATDGQNESAFALPFNLTLEVLVAILFNQDLVEFGATDIGVSKRTPNDAMDIQLNNTGNAYITINHSSSNFLFSSLSSPSTNFRLNVSAPPGQGVTPFNTTLSSTSPLNIDIINQTIIVKFNETARANISYFITVPSAEPAGVRRANVTYLGYYAGR